MERVMLFHVHYEPTPAGYRCEVRALRGGGPDGPVLAEGQGATQCDARDAALAATTDEDVRQALRGSVPDE